MPHFIVGALGTTLPRSLGSSGPMRPHERGVSVHRDDAWVGLPVPVLGGHKCLLSDSSTRSVSRRLRHTRGDAMGKT